jgi:hypothetical protein
MPRIWLFLGRSPVATSLVSPRCLCGHFTSSTPPPSPPTSTPLTSFWGARDHDRQWQRQHIWTPRLDLWFIRKTGLENHTADEAHRPHNEATERQKRTPLAPTTTVHLNEKHKTLSLCRDRETATTERLTHGGL